LGWERAATLRWILESYNKRAAGRARGEALSVRL
jgi:hypothetical protein